MDTVERREAAEKQLDQMIERRSRQKEDRHVRADSTTR